MEWRMRTAACLTLSWDDGHPLDSRVAELMLRHNLRGTFYIPRASEHSRMPIAQIRELSETFEVGAHTLRHVILTRVDDGRAWQEIYGSKRWLEDITGKPCPLFCPPSGRYAKRHLRMAERAGFQGVRTVELLSLDWPRRTGALFSLPTSVQVWPHGARSYVQNAVRRGAFGNLWRYVVHGRPIDWPALSHTLFSEALKRGGVFHLWAHSWEIEDCGAWERLDNLMRFFAEHADQAAALTNGEVCRMSLSRASRFVTEGTNSVSKPPAIPW
jgi:hypothetical protein